MPPVSQRTFQARTAGHIAQVTGMSPVILDEHAALSHGSIYHWRSMTSIRDFTLDFSELVFFFHRRGESGVPIYVEGSLWPDRSNPGGIIIAPPGRSLGFSVTQVDTFTLHIDPICWQLGMDGDSIPQSWNWHGLDFHYLNDDPLLNACFMALEQEATTPSNCNRLYCDSLVDAMMWHILHRYASIDFSPSAKGGLPPNILRRIVDFIEQKIDNDLSTEDLANEAGLSRWHFSRMFKKSTGASPHQYITIRRLEAAKLLLKQAGMSISEVALACGFSSQSHLSSVFVKYTNLSPRQYRMRSGISH